MDSHLADLLEYPVQPQPPEAHGAHAHAPMVYVYEKQKWEYKVIARRTLSEQELNALGSVGWELAGVVPSAETTEFYFKRPGT